MTSSKNCLSHWDICGDEQKSYARIQQACRRRVVRHVARGLSRQSADNHTKSGFRGRDPMKLGDSELQ